MSTSLADERVLSDDPMRTTPLDADVPWASAKPAPAAKRLLGEELFAANLLAPEELEAALKKQVEGGQHLGETLLEMGVVSEEQLLPFIESRLGVTAVRLREGMVDPVALRRIPREVAERLGVLGTVSRSRHINRGHGGSLGPELDRSDRTGNRIGCPTCFCVRPEHSQDGREGLPG